MHLGAILPNYGAGATPDGIRELAGAAEEHGFDSVWTTEHIVVGPDGVEPYGRIYDALLTLAWIAGWTDRVGLGTSSSSCRCTTRSGSRRRRRRCRSSPAGG